MWKSIESMDFGPYDFEVDTTDRVPDAVAVEAKKLT